MAISPRTKLLAHIRRRPLVPLLLAATVCVDVVAILWTPREARLWLCAMALLLGQIGLLGMWISSSWRGWPIRALLTLAAVTLFGIQHQLQSVEPNAASWMTFAGVFATTVALFSLAVRWGLSAWRGDVKIKWQFSMMFLLGAMTLVAVASALIVRSNWLLMNQMTFLLVICEATIAAICLLVTKLIRRPAVVFGIALLLSVVAGLLSFADAGANATHLAGIVIFYGVTVAQYVIWLLAVRVRCAPRWKHKPTLTTDA